VYEATQGWTARGAQPHMGRMEYWDDMVHAREPEGCPSLQYLEEPWCIK